MIGNQKTLEAMRGFSMCTFCREKTKSAVKGKGDNRYILDCKNKNCMVYKSRRIWDSKNDLKKTFGFRRL